MQWYEVYKKPNIGASAQSSYKTALNLHILPVLWNKRLTAISTMDLQELIISKSDTCATIIIIENVFHIIRIGIQTGVFRRGNTEGYNCRPDQSIKGKGFPPCSDGS